MKSTAQRTRERINALLDRHEESHGDLLALCDDDCCILICEIERLIRRARRD